MLFDLFEDVDPGDDFDLIDVRPIGSALGAEIHGVHLADIDDKTFAEVEQALYRYKVLVFRDQTMDHADHDAFTLRFGNHAEDAYTEGLPGYRNVQPLIREADERPIAVFGEAWHSDSPFLDEPPSVTILRSVQTPPWGGDTLYANTALAYRSLSDGMKELVESLRTQFNRTQIFRTREILADHPELPYELIPVASDLVDATDHPLVRTHPVTGEKALYIDGVYTVGFKGLSRAEGAPLVKYLFEQITQPFFVTRIRWEPNMVAMWDNRLVLHHAFNDHPGFRREMYRTIVRGEVPT